MWTFVRTFALSAAILAVAPALGDEGAGQQMTDPFAGEWAVRAVPDELTASEGQDAFSEAILFHNGEFSAAAFAMFGFSPASYTVQSVNGQVTFTATLTSSDRGTLIWTGHEGMSGFVGGLAWQRADGQTYHYVLEGIRPDQN